MTAGFKAVGTPVVANNAASISVGVPSSYAANDTLVILVYSRNGTARSPSNPGGSWSEAARVAGGSANGELAMFYKTASASESSQTISFTGAGSAGTTQIGQMISLKGLLTSSQLGDVGADSTWSAAQNIGPITAVTLNTADQILLVCAGRQQDTGTNGGGTQVSVLSGDSQTWAEIQEYGSTSGTDAAIVWDYAITSGTPSITNKTFTNGDSQTAAGAGFMVAFKAQPAQTVSGALGTLTLTGNAPTVSVPAGVSSSIPAGSLAITGNAPTVLAPRSSTVPAGSLTATGYAPTVLAPRSSDIPAGSISATGNAPTVTATANHLTRADAGSLSATGNAPTIAATVNHLTRADAGSIAITGYAPTVQAPRTSVVPAGTITLSGQAPTVLAPRSAAIPAGSLSLTGNAPTVAAPRTGVIPSGSISVTGNAPTVEVTAGSNVTSDIPAASLSLTGNAPTATAPRTSVVPAGSLTATGNAPTITVSSGAIALIEAGSLSATGNAPTVTVSQSGYVAVNLGNITILGYAPEISALKVAEIPTGSISITGRTPSITASAHKIALIAAGSLTLSGNALTVAAIADPIVEAPSAPSTLAAKGVLNKRWGRGLRHGSFESKY